MAAQYVVVALKVENIHSGWLSSGKLVAPKEDNIQTRFSAKDRCSGTFSFLRSHVIISVNSVTGNQSNYRAT